MNLTMCINVAKSILMHRDTHFLGCFDRMISYYKNDNKGVQADISIENIEEIRDIEVKSGHNLSEDLLSQHQLYIVRKSIDCYTILKSSSKYSGEIPLLISNLILSEEQEPESEIKAIVDMGDRICPYLLMLLESKDFARSTFPGYGLGPELAVKCLGLIKNPKTIPTLFSKIGKVDFFLEDTILEAIKRFGIDSESFLLKMLKSKPFSEDNEKAALALLHFKNSYNVAKEAFGILKSSNRPNNSSFLNYLTIISEGLIGTDLEHEFYDLSNHDCLPKLVREDIIEIKENWSERNKI